VLFCYEYVEITVQFVACANINGQS